MRAGLCRCGEHVFELSTGSGCRLDDVLKVEVVERVVERLQDAHAARRGRRKFCLQLEQHVEVEGEFEHVGLEDREIHPASAVQGLLR